MSAVTPPWTKQHTALRTLSSLAASGSTAQVRELLAFAFMNPISNVFATAQQTLSPPMGAKTQERDDSLFRAVTIGDTDKVAQLIFIRGVSLLSRNSLGRQPLHVAAYAGNALLVLLFCHLGVDLEALDAHGSSALELAIKSGDAATVAALIVCGASVERVFSSLERAAAGPASRSLPICGTLASVGVDFQQKPFLQAHLAVKIKAVGGEHSKTLREFSVLQTVKLA